MELCKVLYGFHLDEKWLRTICALSWVPGHFDTRLKVEADAFAGRMMINVRR